jgi:DNA-binding transcriptional LysR family regulator
MKHLKIYTAIRLIRRQGSIRKAARTLNVTSTTVNRKIISTEARLGIRLFHRTTTGVKLTSADRVVLEHCRRTLFDYDRVRMTIYDIRDLRLGHVDVLTLDSIAISLLPDAVTQLSASYPEVSFSEEGRADVRTLVEKSTPIGVIMPPSHPLAGRNRVGLTDLLGFETVRSIDARGQNSIIDRVMSDVTASLKTRVFTNSLPSAKQMILSGRGVGL